MPAASTEQGNWSYYNPTRVIAGIHNINEIANAQANAQKFVIVTGSSSAESYGYLDQIKRALGARTVTTYSGIPPEPSQSDAEHLKAYLAANRPEAVIALGGGSVIDVAKVACSALESESSIAALMDRKAQLPQRLLGFTAIPTTAGSGSELTPFAVLTNDQTCLKQSLPSPNLYPDLAVIIPEFLSTVPRKVASDTGMDALAHALEALWSIHNNPISDSLAYKAIQLIHSHFIAYLDHPAEFGHANAMAIAAGLAGKAFSNTFTAACHGLSYPIAARFRISHGASCAVILDSIARLNSPAVEEKYGVLCQLLSLESTSDIPSYIASLRLATGCIPDFAGLHATTEDVESIIRDSFKPLMANNPVKLDDATIKSALQND
jgi:alcohol dehydrogenase class IV